MTVGKDVSGLFPDVLKNMQTDDIEQKKLVYLYLMNYAKSQPELVILAVNTFVKVRPLFTQYWPTNIDSLRRMPMIRIHWFVRWLSGQWAVYEQRRSSTTSAIRCRNACEMTTLMSGKPQHCVSPSSTISSQSLPSTMGSWSSYRTWCLTATLWSVRLFSATNFVVNYVARLSQMLSLPSQTSTTPLPPFHLRLPPREPFSPSTPTSSASF